jgi:hypothetical protein
MNAALEQSNEELIKYNPAHLKKALPYKIPTFAIIKSSWRLILINFPVT